MRVKPVLAPSCAVALFSDARDVAEDPVDVGALDREPRATIDPGSPASRGCDVDALAGPMAREACQGGEVERLVLVVEPEVDVGVVAVCSSRAAASEPTAKTPFTALSSPAMARS